MRTASTLARVATLAFLGAGLGGCGFVQIQELDPATMDTSGLPVCSVDLIKSNMFTGVTECRLPLSFAPNEKPPRPFTKEEHARHRALARQACRENRRFCFR